VRRLLGAKAEGMAAERAQAAAHESAAVHERSFLARDETGADGERDAPEFRGQGLEPEQTPEVHSVEVRLHLGYAGSGGEGLDVGHQAARDGR
jgi:hypothetical protein